ncbi:hypothetical protein B0T17DRAFT_494181 [Bombardia bombarda]|uniref:Uncharacterized protein n=1 Tax=Bombardia bombarda TaxID=252184 RepID=A0AA39WUH1_9PEZI|nr:hypothetical protein B0T17DRAFT_494181 [Bombardia bombarda]
MSDSLDASAPAATPSEGPGLVLIAPPPGKGCTSTLSESFSYPCSWDGTSTIYPSTTILYKQVNCHGCDSVKVQADYWFCPNQQVSYTAKALSASTYWSTLCAPSTAAARLIKLDAPATATANRLAADHTPNAIPNAANNNMDRAVAACPTTYVVQPEQSAGRTSTKYSKIMTTTLLLECSGCPLVVSTALIGYGQVGHFTTTTTLPVGTTTAYACH